MKKWKHGFPQILILAAIMVGLLAVLAFLQYRWMGEVSQADRERRRAGLQDRTTRFCRDFDREITRAFFQFSFDPRDGANWDWEHLQISASAYCAPRYLSWQATATFPKIVQDLFLVVRSPSGTVQLSRFAPQTRQFEDTQWPEGLMSVREQIQQQMQREEEGPVEPSGYQLPPAFPEVPALVIPYLHFPSQRRSDRGNTGDRMPFRNPLAAMMIVRFDETYLIKEFLLPLLNRNFFQGNEPDYDVAILKHGNSLRFIYQSSPTVHLNPERTMDASAHFFMVRPDELVGSLTDHFPADRRSMRFGVPFWRPPRPASPLSAASSTAEGDHSDGGWLILLQHRAGSLDAAVTSARRRNLAISFGILLLLSASMVLIIVSSRRAQFLARQQMDFIAGVSHELRTPLSVICSAGENLADGMIGSPEQARKYGTLIRDEGRRLAGMVEQVLTFAGVQSGKKVYNLQPLDPIKLVEDALEDCHPLLSQGGFQVETRFSLGIPDILGDSAALSICLHNLLSNAIQYTGASRWIGITLDTDGSETQKQVLLTVADKGIGIEPEDLPHIFAPFYRGSTVTKAQIHGTGLGLSLVKRIIEAHGGRIQVKSKPSEGSSFTLQLPAYNLNSQ